MAQTYLWCTIRGAFIKYAYFDNERQSRVSKHHSDVTNKLQKLPNLHGIKGEFLPMLYSSNFSILFIIFALFGLFMISNFFLHLQS